MSNATAKKDNVQDIQPAAKPLGIYGRLAKVRDEFHKLDLKKTGHNKFSDYRYFELEDFLVQGLALLSKYDLLSVVSFTKEYATLTLYSTTDSETLTITSPMSTASLKACHEIQNLGAVESYETRYLYISLFQLVENDGLENTQPAKKAELATPEQLAALHDYASNEPEAGLMTPGQVAWIEKAGDKITTDQAAYVLEKLKEKENEADQ